MNHLDEGTIHAWLDGAIDAQQSREIEAHVGGCAACSAAVAEARGLIAGASRILGALDYVPGGVIPGGASAAPQSDGAKGVTPIATRRGASRRRRVTQWASGVAAVLVAAIVLSTSSKIDRSAEFSAAGPRALDSDTGVVVAPVAPTIEAGAASPDERRESGADAAQRRAAGAGVAERGEDASFAPPASAPARDRSERSKAGVGAVASSAAPVANQAQRAPDTTEQRPVSRIAADALPGVVTTSVARDTTRLRSTGSARLESVVVTSLGAESAPTVGQLAGCYRVDPSPALDTTRMRITDRASTEQRPERSRAAPAAAAAQRAANVQIDTVTSAFATTPALIRLDTTLTASGFNVFRLTSDSTVGSWSIVRDSVRVNLGGRVVMLSPQQKVTCPQPRRD